MKSKVLLIIFTCTTVVVLLMIVAFPHRKWEGSSPLVTPSEMPSSPQAPKTFDFDASTDLNKELDTINPEVLDSDFDE